MTDRKCEQCGIAMPDRKRKFCSSPCRRIAVRIRENARARAERRAPVPEHILERRAQREANEKHRQAMLAIVQRRKAMDDNYRLNAAIRLEGYINGQN